MIWLEFLLCLVVIAAAGVNLSRYGDAIADKTRMGGTWVGVILLATVTSLPELVTGVSSVTAAGVPDIAVGDVLGSCVFNLLIIVILDAIHRPASVFTKASQGHILSAAFGIILIGIAGFNMVLSDQGFGIQLGHVGLYTPVILITYVVAIRTVFRYEKSQMAKFAVLESDQYPNLSLRQAIVRYCIAAFFIVLAGSFLPFVGERMAIEMGWHQSFVGTLFIAFATSLPEIAVTVSALKLGAIDMAIGGLFGSNLFNIMILAVDDILYTKAPLFEDIASGHSASALSAMIMTGLAIMGILYPSKTRVLRLTSWVSIFLLSAYLINSFVLYLYGQ